MSTFIFIATSWGATHGGINSFNHNLCIALSQKYIGHEIICLTDDIDSSDIKEYSKIRISLKSLKKDKFHNIETIMDLLKNEIQDSKEVYWIGHDIYTGKTAVKCSKACKKIYNNKNTKSIVFHHMDYSDYYTSKSKNIENSEEKQKLQAEIITSSDIVVAIGPTLKASAISKIDKNKKDDEIVFELIPGITEDLPEVTNPKNRAVIIGRIDDDLKQARLTAAAFGQALKALKDVSELQNTKLHIVGYANPTKEDYKEIDSFVSQYSGKSDNVEIIPFINSHKEVLKYIAESKLCIVPSLYEGFSLVGCESIATATPLILTKRSGLYEMLKNLGLDLYITNIKFNHIVKEKVNDKLDLDDLNNLSDKIKEVLEGYKSHKRQSESLHKELKKFTWDETAKNFIRIINPNIQNSVFKHNNNDISENTEKNINLQTYNFNISHTSLIDNYFFDFFLLLFQKYLISNNSHENIRCIIVLFDEDDTRHTWFDSSKKVNINRQPKPKNFGIVGNVSISGNSIFHDFKRNKSYRKGFSGVEVFSPQIDTGKADCHAILASPIFRNREMIGAITFDFLSNQNATVLENYYKLRSQSKQQEFINELLDIASYVSSFFSSYLTLLSDDEFLSIT